MLPRSLVVLWGVLVICLPLSAESLTVRHDHDPWGSCEGLLTIGEEGIRYATEREGHSRFWDWVDVQGFDRKSPEVFSLLTYEDLYWHAGLDKNYDFTVLPGSDELDDGLLETIARNLSRPVTDRVPKSIEAEYEVPVKHLHVFGGCEGMLLFGSDWIVYDSPHAAHRRSWRRVTQVESVWSSNPFEIEIRVLEEDRRTFSKSARFTFQLKRPVDAEYLEALRREVLVAR